MADGLPPAEADTNEIGGRTSRLDVPIRALCRLTPRPDSVAAHLFAIFCVAVAVAVPLALGALTQGIVAFATFFPAVTIAALVGGTLPGVTALVFGGIASWFFLLEPHGVFSTPLPADAVNIVLYTAAASLILVVVADRRSAEFAMRREVERAKLYFETAGVMLVVIDADRKVQLINRCGADVLGTSASNIIGRDWIDTVVPPRLKSTAIAVFNRCLQGATNQPECREGIIMRADGAERTIDWRNTLLTDSDGRPIAILSSGEDVTERRRSERAIEESEARFRALAESMPQLVWSAKGDGYCDYLSRQWLQYTGAASEKHCGFGWLEAVHPEDRDQISACWAAAVAEISAYDVEYRLRRHDGTYRWFAARGCPLRDEAGRIQRWFGTSTDITDIIEARVGLERRVAERTRELEESNRMLRAEAAERAKAEEALTRIQRLEAIAQLTGGVAHDFNNLLTVIVGNLDMISRSADDPIRVRQLAATALGAADRGESVTRQLLAFSRQQSLRPEVVDLVQLLEDFEPLARRGAGDSIELRLEIESFPLYSRIDSSQFETAILNLIVNARDATPPGGVIALSAAPYSSRSIPTDDLHDPIDGEYIEIRVTDTGCGITPDVLPRVFEPFFTTKEVGKGSGLGLSQVYGFVSQSGGQIRIDSTPGAGTAMRVLLPRLVDVVESRQSRTVVEAPIQSNGETVLVVEDDPEVLQSSLGMLRSLGYAVQVAHNGPEAVAVLESQEKVDLLFTDVVMPGGMSGVDVVRHARDIRPDLPVLLTSGYTARALSEQHGVAECLPMLRKPYRVAELARAVRESLHAARAPASEGPVIQPRVLLVEDEALLRLSAIALLEECGFDVVGDVSTGEAALARLGQLNGNVDVLFTDVRLPGMDGRMLAREAVRRCPGLRVVLATGYSRDLAQGAQTDAIVLEKPYDRRDLERLRNQLTVRE